MVVYYRLPPDTGAFERRYIDGHLPLVQKYERMQTGSFNKVSRVLMGEFPYAYAFVGTWADRDAWKADMQSEQAMAATADAQEFATQGFDVVVFEELA
jgi:uncharacterized protein (TIGR02118 family)